MVYHVLISEQKIAAASGWQARMRTNRQDKKAIERLFLERFREVYSDFPPGQIVESESPDFLVCGPSRTIGIEIERYVSGQGPTGSPEREQEMIRDRILQTARTKYEVLGLPPLWVVCFWYPGITIDWNSCSLLGSALAQIIARSIPQTVPGKSEVRPEDLEGTVLEYIVVCVDIMRYPSVTQNAWGNCEAGCIGVDESEVQLAIRLKEPKASEYLKKCDEAWLLIVADGSHISSTASLDTQDYSATHETRFSRVILFDFQEPKIVAMNMAHPSP
jgi:hypothetical protein